MAGGGHFPIGNVGCGGWWTRGCIGKRSDNEEYRGKRQIAECFLKTLSLFAPSFNFQFWVSAISESFFLREYLGFFCLSGEA